MANKQINNRQKKIQTFHKKVSIYMPFLKKEIKKNNKNYDQKND